MVVDEHDPDPGPVPGRAGADRCDRLRVDARAAPQDLRLQPAQPGTRVQAELVGEPAPDPLVHRQRLARLAAAVQGEHELPGQPLPYRFGRDQTDQLVQQLGMAPQAQPRIDAVLDRGQPCLGQALAQPLAALGRAGIGERRSGPQRQRLVEQGDPGIVVDLRTGPLQELTEPMNIDGLRLDPQRVPGPSPDQLNLGRRYGGEDRAQPGDAHPYRVRGGPGRVRPDQLDQPLDRYQPVDLQRQGGEDEALLRRSEHKSPALMDHADRPEQPELHWHPPQLRRAVPTRESYGSRAVTVVPRRPPRTSQTPPASAARSAIDRSPSPARSAPRRIPVPSSVTVRTTASATAARRTVARLAAPCRMALASASAPMRSAASSAAGERSGSW